MTAPADASPRQQGHISPFVLSDTTCAVYISFSAQHGTHCCAFARTYSRQDVRLISMEGVTKATAQVFLYNSDARQVCSLMLYGTCIHQIHSCASL